MAGSLVQGGERRVSVRRRRVRGKIAAGGRVGHVAPRRAVPAPSSRTPRVRLSSTSTPSTTAQPAGWLASWLAGSLRLLRDERDYSIAPNAARTDHIGWSENTLFSDYGSRYEKSICISKNLYFIDKLRTFSSLRNGCQAIMHCNFHTRI